MASVTITKDMTIGGLDTFPVEDPTEGKEKLNRDLKVSLKN